MLDCQIICSYKSLKESLVVNDQVIHLNRETFNTISFIFLNKAIITELIEKGNWARLVREAEWMLRG